MSKEIPDHYSLIKENDDHFLVHDSRDGKAFPIAKRPLHPAHQIRLMKLKKFSDGGDSEEDGEESVASVPSMEATPEIQEDMSMAAAPSQTNLGFVPDMTQQPQAQPSWHAPMLPETQMPPPSGSAENQIQAPTPPQPTDILSGIPGMDLAKRGLEAQYASQAGLARDQQSALNTHQKAMDDMAAQHQRIFDNLDNEQADYQQRLADGKIDPHRYFNDMSTGKRVGTALALILGGIGAGLTNGPNVAVQLMNKAVDDDIMAQKADLGKTENLLNLNMRKYGNAHAAEAATRLQYNTTLQTQLQAAQSKATNGVALAHLNMGLAGLQQQAFTLKNEMAKNMVKGQSLGVGTGEGGIPEGQEPPSLLLDPKYRESRVVVNGNAYQANDKESAGKLRDVHSLAGPVIDGVKELGDLANDPSTRFAGSPSNLKAHAIMGDLAVKLPLLSGATIGAKRVNSEEIAHQIQRFQDPTRFDQSLGGVKNDQFFKSLEKELESVRTQHLIGYKGMGKIKSFAPLTGGKLPRNQ